MFRVGLVILSFCFIRLPAGNSNSSGNYFTRFPDGTARGLPGVYCARGAGSEYQFENGTLKMNSKAHNPTIEFGNSNWNNCILKIRVRWNRGGNWFGISIPNGTLLQIFPQEKKATLLASDRSELNSTELSLNFPNQDEHILLALSGNSLKVLVNDQMVFSGEAKFIPRRNLKLHGSWQSNIRWMSLEISELEPDDFIKLSGTAPRHTLPETSSEKQRKDWTVLLKNAPVSMIYPVSSTVELQLKSDTRMPQTEDLFLRVVDFWDRIVFQKTVSGAETAGRIAFPLPAAGPYRAELHNSNRELLAETVFGALPLVRKMPDPNSHFGISSILDPPHLHLATLSGAGWLRLHDMDLATYWAGVEPQPGQYHWRDEAIDLAISRGFQIMGGFEATPPWASNAPGEVKANALVPRSDPSIWRPAWGYPPANLKDVERYVRETVRHYKGRIRAYEVWNEPHVDLFWKGSVKEYVEMSKVIYKAVKAEDPDCLVVGGGGINLYSWPWLEEAFKRGLLNHLDILSIHGLDQDAIATINSEELNSWIGKLFTLMESYGRKVPVWMSEGGGGSPSFLLDANLHDEINSVKASKLGAADLVRSWLIGRSRGIDRLFWWRMRHWGYDYHENNRAESMIEHTGAPKPTFYAHAAMCNFLGSASFRERIEYSPYVRCLLFDSPEGAVVVLWTLLELEQNARLVLPAEDFPVEYFDLLGNSIDLPESPVRELGIGYYPTYLRVKNKGAGEIIPWLKKGSLQGLYISESARKSEEQLREERRFLESRKAAFEFAAQQDDDAWFQVDLRKFTNMGFADEVASDGTGGWCDGGPYNDMRDMPLGKRSYCGVPFDIIDPTRNNGTSIITLASPHAVNFPRAVRNIPVNEKAQRLYFFNSCAWGERAGIMGEYVITYADGEKLHIPLESGVNNGDWWLPPGPSETTRVAAIPTYNYTVYQYRIKYLRVFEWVNPSPGKTISRIDFVSNRQSAIPILLAISGVKTER